MIARRWAIVGGASAALAGMYLAATYFQARAAGELSGTFAWARYNGKCLHWPYTRDRDAVKLIVDDLEKYRAWWPEAFASAFVGSHERLNAVEEAVGYRKMCELYISPYAGEIGNGSVRVGLWWFHVPPAPAPEPTSAPPYVPVPLPEPSIVSPVEPGNDCPFIRDLLLERIMTAEEAIAKCPSLAGSKTPVSTPTAAGPPAGIRFDHGVSRRQTASGDAPFKIVTQAGANYFFKLVHARTGDVEIAGFIVGGTPLETRVPTGDYELRYAGGQTWISEQEFFGTDTAFAKTDSPLNFTFDGSKYRGVEVQLILQRGGNLRTRAIKRSEF